MYSLNQIKTSLRHSLLTGFVMLGLMLSAGLLTSCTEDNNEVEEFADWKAVNDKYWTNLYNETKQKIANGDTSWKIILNYSYQNQVHNADGTQTYAPEKHIIVHELEKGKGAGVPLFTDSVHVHYQGRLLPSTTYTSGLIFDSSWGFTDFNANTARPAQMRVSKVVDGFATALQNMHIGDHWVVYVPYQLGYGNREVKGIPTYSNLIFDLRLHSYYRANNK